MRKNTKDQRRIEMRDKLDNKDAKEKKQKHKYATFIEQLSQRSGSNCSMTKQNWGLHWTVTSTSLWNISKIFNSIILHINSLGDLKKYTQVFP